MGKLLRPGSAFTDEGKKIFHFYEPEPLKDFIKKHYNLKISRIAPLGWGHGNMFFYIRADGKKYSARIARLRRNLKKRIMFEDRVTKYLTEQGISVKETVPTSDNKEFIEFEDGPIFQLQTFLEGMIPHPIRRFHIKKAGRFLRKFHDSSKYFYKELPEKLVKSHKLDLIPTTKDIKEGINLINLNWKYKYHQTDVKGFQSAALDFLTKSKEIKDHPTFKRLDFLHGDYNAGNVVFVNDKISGVLDFEHAAFGPSTYDYGYALAHYSFGFYRKDTKKIMQSFIKGYGKADDKDLLEYFAKTALLKRAVDVIRYKKNYAEREFWEGELENYTDRFLRFKLWY